MKRRIYIQMTAIAAIASLATMLLVAFVCYELFCGQILDDLRTDAYLLKEADNLENIFKSDEIVSGRLLRVTWVDDRGAVIFENYASDARFLSSGSDGFLREYINLPVDRVVPCGKLSPKLAAVTEFVSVAAHSVRRFSVVSHERRDTIAVWGDGSLAFVMANILRLEFPESKIVVIGKNSRKLSYFSFINETILADCIPDTFSCDHAFECCGGEGSYYAIEDIIRYIRPQGSVMLMGVSENRVAINTRDILEKGLTFVGSSRSGREDFEKAVACMQDRKFQKRLELIVYEDEKVNSVGDLHRVFQTDAQTPFKTVFEWGL